MCGPHRKRKYMCLHAALVCVKIVSAAHSHRITQPDYLFSFFTCHCVCKTLACCFVLLHLASGSHTDTSSCSLFKRILDHKICPGHKVDAQSAPQVVYYYCLNKFHRFEEFQISINSLWVKNWPEFQNSSCLGFQETY